MMTYNNIQISNNNFRTETQNELKQYVSAHLNILNHVPYIIFFKDLAGNIVIGNKQFNELANGLLNKELSEFTTNKPENTILETLKPISFEQCFETTTGNKWLDIYKAPMFNEKQNIIGIIITAKDITEQKAIDEQKELLVATLVHDLKSPTSAQIQALKLLLKETYGTLTQNQIEIIKEIKNSCEYSFSIVETLLCSYKYENYAAQLEYSEFCLTDLCLECKNTLHTLAVTKLLPLNMTVNCTNSNIMGDKLEIKRVIMNLLTNAISYAKPKTDINIIINAHEDKIRFEVTNQAEYIPQEELTQLFQKHFSKAQKFFKLSTGLGLYLSKQIIHAHNGNIVTKSTEDGKISFGFELNSANYYKNCN